MSAHVEGRNAVLEALRGGLPLARILIASGAKPDPALERIGSLAAAAGIPVQRVERAEIDRIAESRAHQGVLGIGRPFEYTPLEVIVERCASRPAALIVVLDHVTDPGNLGAVLRSAEVAGGAAVIIPAQRAAAVGPVVHKASAGATAHLPVVRVTNIARTLAVLKDAGFWIAGAEGAGGIDLWRAPLEGRLAVVLGSEGSGLSRLVAEGCDFLVSIPMEGRVGSLNVAQAATVLAYEWLRRCRGV